MPLFLLGFGLLYLVDLLRRWREFLLALLVAAVVLAPAAVFFSRQTATGTMYFRRTTFLDEQQAWQPQLERFVQNYQQFFSARFLLEEGDPIFRHSVRGHGELYPFFIPFILLGAGTLLLRRDRASKLILWWLALYPVAPSLMNEIPSATRGVIGAPVFALLAGVGFASALRVLRWLAGGRRWGMALQAAAIVAAAIVCGPQVVQYMHAYFVEYPTYAALTPGAFQFGYRDMIEYMESERGHYDLLLLSATDSNQPQIFAQFYRPVDPREWATRRDPGYLIVKPDEFSRYRPDQRVLAGLHPDDVDLFSDIEVKRRIEGPGRQIGLRRRRRESAQAVPAELADARRLPQRRPARQYPRLHHPDRPRSGALHRRVRAGRRGSRCASSRSSTSISTASTRRPIRARRATRSTCAPTRRRRCARRARARRCSS